MFKFTIGETYQTQGGETIRLVERWAAVPSHATVVDEEGIHRYDRSYDDHDAGRVTGTAFDYSDPRNIAKESS